MSIYSHIHNQGAAEAAGLVLSSYQRSQMAMKEAADALLAFSSMDITPEAKANYRRHHKRMTRLIRLWNRLEHEREDWSSTETDGVSG